MSFFESPFTVAATASLIIQLLVLGLLFYGFMLKKNQKFRQHGLAMLGAVVLHAITIFAVMMPSFAGGFSGPGAFDFSNMMVVLAVVHTVTGVFAFLLGIVLVVTWRLRTDLKPCFQKKQLMRVTIVIWMIALVLGVVLYWLFYIATYAM
jgi:uncharacterized membrane protein YozB (DUF420 family)